MAAFTAADVKKLRELSGAGMMDAKKALTEADGDIDADDVDCQTSWDDDESTANTICEDDSDNDDDGWTDKDDPDCYVYESEIGIFFTQCNNFLDDDSDGDIDSDDSDCEDGFDNDETSASAACTDGADNDAKARGGRQGALEEGRRAGTRGGRGGRSGGGGGGGSGAAAGGSGAVVPAERLERMDAREDGDELQVLHRHAQQAATSPRRA